jgi:hypothetical protein
MAAKQPLPAVGDTINIDSHPARASPLPCPLHSLECLRLRTGNPSAFQASALAGLDAVSAMRSYLL